MELGERYRQLLGRGVDDGISGEDAAESAIRQVQRGHRTLVEPQAWVGLPGQRDHRWGQVEAEGGQPEKAQVCRCVAGAAAEIGHRTGTGGVHELGECGKHRPVQRLGLEGRAETLGVRDGDGVVGRPGGVQIGRL